MLTLEQQAADETTPIAELRKLAQRSRELAQIVAQNPGADSELLRELAAHSDLEVRRGVAGNPNISIELLFKLGEEFPKQLLENPSLLLLLLENPNLLDSLPRPVMESILKQEQIPASFLTWAVNRRWIDFSTWLAKQHGTPERILVELATRAISERSEQWFRFLVILIRNPNTPDDVLEMIVTRNHKNREKRADLLDLILAARLNLSVQIMEILATHGKEATKIQLAERLDAPASLLRKFAEERSSTSILCALASNRNTPMPILCALASNPDTPIPVLMTLLKSGNLSIQKCLASNPAMPQQAILGFSISGSREIRVAVAKHPSTPKWMLRRLSKDRHLAVQNAAREALRNAKNSKTN